MRKTSWIFPAVFIVAIGVSSPQAATTFTPVFTCTGSCNLTPTAGDVSFPSPIILETWLASSTTGIDLAAGDQPTDTYTWNNNIIPDSTPGLGDFALSITDVTTGDSPFEFGMVGIDTMFPMSISDSGTLTFSPSGSTTPGVPEPSTWTMMLIGFAGLFVAYRQTKRPQMLIPVS
jgi:PEP-CTERM motif